jgi:hypothetical protein
MVEDSESMRGFRTVTVRGWIVEMLTEDGAGRGVTRSDPDAFVFVTPDGFALHYSNRRERAWLPATEAAGFEGCTFMTSGTPRQRFSLTSPACMT